MSSPIWFITGVSSGLGLEIALAALRQKHRVIGTVRNRQRASAAVEKIENAAGKVLELDVTHPDACFQVFHQAEKVYGQIDILCNNSGVSFLGTIEDFTDQEVHSQMDVCLYGPMRLIRASLPGFRKRRQGTIINVTSIAGVDGLPSCGLYAASKFALEGLSESLAREMADYNVDVLVVEPGAFRTNFLGAFVTNSKATLDDYPSAKAVMDKFDGWGGKQPGDPVKAAERIVEVVSGTGTAGALKGKTLRLPLGPDCVARVEAKIKALTDDLETTRNVAMSTDHKE